VTGRKAGGAGLERRAPHSGRRRVRTGDTPTIRDVALAARVAVGTVSRVLNGHKSVSEDVRRRVMKAVSKLRYEPDRVAQSMRLGITRTVALAVRDITMPGFGSIVNAAEEVLRGEGYTLLLAITDERKEREIDLIRIFLQRRVDAIIMTTSNEEDAELRRHIRQLTIPVVLLDRDLPSEVDSVTIDHRRGIRTATDYLLGLGHTRIALLTGRASMRPARERIAGFEEALAAAKRSHEAVVRTGGFSAEFGFRETSTLLSNSKPPSAIIAGGMAMLAGVLRAVRVHGLLVPDDISVVAGADTDLAALTTPSVTAVQWSGADEGRLAVQLLLERLRGERSGPARHIMLGTELVTRGSCAPPGR
jgi:LacI family transcriptional regulator